MISFPLGFLPINILVTIRRFHILQQLICRAVATGWAGWAMAHPLFRGFKGRTCKMIHLRYNFLLLGPPGFEMLSTALIWQGKKVP